MRVLLVDADPRRAAPIRAALAEAGHEVGLAAGAAFALTMLERQRPDVLVTRLELPDMYAYELCAIVRSDPMTRDIPFVVLTDRAPAGPEAVAQAVAELPAPPEEAAPAVPPAAPPPAARPRTDLLPSGQLPDMVRAVSDGRRTGKLVGRVGPAGAALLFEAGRLLHAEFGGQTGEQAVSSLMAAAGPGSAPAVRFRFEAADGSEVPRTPRRVDEAAHARLLRACAEAPPEGG